MCGLVLNPRVSRFLQPAIQFAASFPAPMLYPIVLGWILAVGGNLGWGAVALMMLGAQWYISVQCRGGRAVHSGGYGLVR